MRALRVAAVALICTACWFYWQPRDGQLTIVILNIGQGDAIYIRTPHGNDILVDGGPDRTVLNELGMVMPPFDHTIEYVIASHPDADHIAGLMEVTDNYDIAHLITNGHGKETGVAREFANWMQIQGMQSTVVQRGARIDIEQDVWIDILAPTEQEHENTNDDSIVMILHVQDRTAMFTGDAPNEEEDSILAAYPPESLRVDLLKIGHHGSRFSTSDAWLEALQPTVAVVSAGIQNRYHHPHPTVMHRLQKAGIPTFRTDTQGRITCTANAETITCAPQHN